MDFHMAFHCEGTICKALSTPALSTSMSALPLLCALCLLGLALSFRLQARRQRSLCSAPQMAKRSIRDDSVYETDRLYSSSPGETRRMPSSSLEANRREVAKVVVSFAILYLTLTTKAQEVSAALQKRFGSASSGEVMPEPVATDGANLVVLNSGIAYSETPLPSSSTTQTSSLASLRTKLVYNGVEIRQNADNNLPIIVTASGAATVDARGITFMVPSLSEAVEGMLVGCRRRVAVPAALAFGAAGLPPLVPPDANVIFEVELAEV